MLVQRLFPFLHELLQVPLLCEDLVIQTNNVLSYNFVNLKFTGNVFLFGHKIEKIRFYFVIIFGRKDHYVFKFPV